MQGGDKSKKTLQTRCSFASLKCRIRGTAPSTQRVPVKKHGKISTAFSTTVDIYFGRKF